MKRTPTSTVRARAPSPQTPTPRRLRSALLAATVPLALIGTARAQDGATWLDTLTVIGTRTAVSVQDNPASVTVVDREQIERSAPASIAELLRDVPGVQVVDSSAPGMQRLRIRGESSRRVTILVDGQEITDHSTFGTPILIDPSNVERIEVLRGPASVLHGAKAIGGVVNIITRRGADKPFEAEIGGSYYSGTAGWQGWGALSGTQGNVDYRLSGGLDDHGDRRVPKGRYSDNGRLDGTSFDNDNISGHLGYTFGAARNHYVSVKATQHRLSTESWTDPSLLSGTTRSFLIDLPQRDLRKVGFYYEGKDLAPVVRQVHLDVYHQTVDRLFLNEVVTAPGIFPGNIKVATTSDDENVNWGGTAQVDLQFHPDHYTIVGLQYLADELTTAKTSRRTSTVPIVPNTYSESLDDAEIRTTSAFAQNEWSFADNFTLIAGLRYYRTETALNHTTDPNRSGHEGRRDSSFVTSAGLTYTGLDNTTLRALYSEGYITPTLLQLFTDTTPAGQMLYGNPLLDPETSRNFEIGARYNAGPLALDVTAFYTEAEDYITTMSCSAAPVACPTYGTLPVRTIHVNANEAQTYGIELTADYTLAGTMLTPYVTGAWMRRNLEFADFSTYHSDTPSLSGRLGVRWEGQVAQRAVWSDVFVRAATRTSQEERTGTTATIDRLPGYGTLNLAVGGALDDNDRFRYAIGLNNIFDKEYRSSFSEIPGTGRNIEVTARMTF